MPRQSRREARLARQADAQVEQAAKSARLIARPEFQIARRAVDPSDLYHSPMAWTCQAPDREGSWSRSGAARDWTDEQWQTVLNTLEQLAKLTWGEIDGHTTDTGHKKHHGMDVDVICEEAQYRLVEIDRLESDTIFRFRLGNRPRLWGFRHGANFDVVWLDREHDVYPTDPD